MKKSSKSELRQSASTKSGSQLIQITKEDIEKNRKRSGSSDDILISVGYLEKVENALKKKLMRPPTRQEVIDEMAAIGLDITISTLWRYRAKIKKKQAWFRELITEGTYSAHLSDVSDLLDYIQEKAIEYLNTKWTNSKMVKKTGGKSNKQQSTEQTVTAEISTPKYQFLNILNKAAELKMRLLSGENLNLDAALLAEDYQNTKEKADDLERKFKEAEKEIKRLQQESEDGKQTSSSSQ